jgi:hypothetical protein
MLSAYSNIRAHLCEKPTFAGPSLGPNILLGFYLKGPNTEAYFAARLVYGSEKFYNIDVGRINLI